MSTATPPAAPRPTAPPPTATRPVAPPPTTEAPRVGLPAFEFEIGSERDTGGGRIIGIYGPGGIGKSSFARTLSNCVVIGPERGTDDMDVMRVKTNVASLTQFRAILNSPLLDKFEHVVIDTYTRVEELALEHIIAEANKARKENATAIRNIEDFGYGKGYPILAAAMKLVKQDILGLRAKGKFVWVLAHDVLERTETLQEGHEYRCYGPRFMGKAQAVKEYVELCDELWFMQLSMTLNDAGVMKSAGNRIVYTTMQPFCNAKTRAGMPSTMLYQMDAATGKPSTVIADTYINLVKGVK